MLGAEVREWWGELSGLEGALDGHQGFRSRNVRLGINWGNVFFASAMPVSLFLPRVKGPRRTPQEMGFYDQANFDRGTPLCGGLALVCHHKELYDELVGLKPHMLSCFVWSAVLGGTATGRETVMRLAEIALLITTLLFTIVIPAMTTSREELAFEGDDARIAAYSSVLLGLNGATLSLTFTSFGMAWFMLWQSNIAPTSLTFIFWLARNLWVERAMVLTCVAAVVLALVSALLTMAAQTVDYEFDVAILSTVFLFILLAFAFLWSCGQLEWFHPPKRLEVHIGLHVVAGQLKEEALERLKDIHDAWLPAAVVADDDRPEA